MTPFKLYMPLTINHYARNRHGDWEEDPSQISPEQAVDYEDKILAALVHCRHPEEAGRGLMHWYHEDDAVNAKIRRAEFSVEVVDGELMGTVECLADGELTPEETERFHEYLAGQASDGFGEGFEQREITVPDGEIYVHLWNSEPDWGIMTEDELYQQMHQIQEPQMDEMSC